MKIRFENVSYKGLAVALNQCPQDGLPEVVLAGRSNVGKSSLINGLCQRKQIARVSSTPGKTQSILYFLIDQIFYLTDLPGYGYTKTSQEKRTAFFKLVDSYLESDRPIQLVLHLIDIRHQPSESDLRMTHWLQEKKMPFIYVFTKADKLSKAQIRRQLSQLKSALPALTMDNYAVISNTKRTGYDALKNLISQAIGLHINESVTSF